MNERKRSCQDRASHLSLSSHAGRRIRQRGLCEADVELISEVGEEFQDGYLMSSRSIGERIRRLKAEIQQLERLAGVVLIEDKDTVITVYRADHKRCKRILRHGKSKARANTEVAHEKLAS